MADYKGITIREKDGKFYVLLGVGRQQAASTMEEAKGIIDGEIKYTREEMTKPGFAMSEKEKKKLGIKNTASSKCYDDGWNAAKSGQSKNVPQGCIDPYKWEQGYREYLDYKSKGIVNSAFQNGVDRARREIDVTIVNARYLIKLRDKNDVISYVKQHYKDTVVTGTESGTLQYRGKTVEKLKINALYKGKVRRSITFIEEKPGKDNWIYYDEEGMNEVYDEIIRKK